MLIDHLVYAAEIETSSVIVLLLYEKKFKEFDQYIYIYKRMVYIVL